MNLVGLVPALALCLLVPLGCVVDDAPPSEDDTTEGVDPETDSDDSSEGGSCGDGFRSEGEECDGADFGAATCVSLGGGTGGSLVCTDQCTIDSTSCTECGNGVIDGQEQCDGFNLDGQTCESQGAGSGELACSSCAFDTSGCGPGCGDGRVQDGEACDGSDLAGASCESLLGAGGTLGCTAECAYDDSGCFVCGDSQIDPGEECDTLMTDSKGLWYTCAKLLGGSFSGQVVCADDCTIDSSMCFECGNGVLEGLEACDGMDLGGTTCEDLGEPPGALGCTEFCTVDVSGCGA